MPRALKACGSCGTPTQKTPCPSCRPSGRHTQTAKQRGNTRRMQTLAARAKQKQPWCAWPTGCDLPVDADNPLTADHNVPRIVDPTRMYDPTNLVVLCRTHNSRKGTRIVTPDGRLVQPEELGYPPTN